MLLTVKWQWKKYWTKIANCKWQKVSIAIYPFAWQSKYYLAHVCQFPNLSCHLARCYFNPASLLGDWPVYVTVPHIWNTLNTNLVLAECEVRTASYGPSFFLPFMAQARSMRAMKTRKEKTRIHNLPYGLSKRG